MIATPKVKKPETEEEKLQSQKAIARLLDYDGFHHLLYVLEEEVEVFRNKILAACRAGDDAETIKASRVWRSADGFLTLIRTLPASYRDLLAEQDQDPYGY